MEKQVIARAQTDPETSPDYFMAQIEHQPAPNIEKQAVYLYGMAIAYERMNNMADATDFYRAAELFGHHGAAEALIRLNMPPFERP